MKGMIIAFTGLCVLSVVLLEFTSRFCDWIDKDSFDELDDDLI